MNVHLCRVALRPRGPLEVFDLAIALLRAHPGPFGRLALLLLPLPAALLSVGAFLTEGHWAWLVAAIALAPLLHAPFTVLGGRLLFADDWTVRQVLAELFGRPGAALAAVAWPFTAWALGALMCGAPLLLALPFTVFVGEAALLERTPATALNRSANLAMFSPFGAFAAASVLVVGTLWAVAVAEVGGHLLFDWLLEFQLPVGHLEEGVVTPYAIVGALAFQPILALYKLLLFVDVRTRVDGWDLQVGIRAARLAAEARGG